MGLFSNYQFPWTDLHTLNLNWLLETVKKLADSYKPVAKTDDMTQPVGVDSNGQLFTAPGGGGGGDYLPLAGGTMEEGAQINFTEAGGGHSELSSGELHHTGNPYQFVGEYNFQTHCPSTQGVPENPTDLATKSYVDGKSKGDMVALIEDAGTVLSKGSSVAVDISGYQEIVCVFYLSGAGWTASRAFQVRCLVGLANNGNYGTFRYDIGTINTAAQLVGVDVDATDNSKITFYPRLLKYSGSTLNVSDYNSVVALRAVYGVKY